LPRPNIHGGGARTNENGLKFQQRKSLSIALSEHREFIVRDDIVFRNGEKVAELCGGNKLYVRILKPRGVDYKEIISKKLLPDDAILIGNRLYIIEKKYQNGPGSVVEKLQTCDFKKKQYSKLLSRVGIAVEYYYVFNDWFRKKEYEDVHNYFKDVRCKYYFDEIPLQELGF
jgi:hypothetical protein